MQTQMKVSTLAVDKLGELRRQVEDSRIICSVDGGFTNRAVFRRIPEKTTLIGRIRKDAKLFSQPEEESGSRRGRRKFYGKPLPTPEETRQDENIPWRVVEAFAAGKRHHFEVKVMPRVRWKGTGERERVYSIAIPCICYARIRIWIWNGLYRPMCGVGK